MHQSLSLRLALFRVLCTQLIHDLFVVSLSTAEAFEIEFSGVADRYALNSKRTIHIAQIILALGSGRNCLHGFLPEIFEFLVAEIQLRMIF